MSTLFNLRTTVFNLGSVWNTESKTHGAGTHSIEGKKWQENAEHNAQDIWGCSAFMLSKWDSYCMVDLRSPSQNFFRAPPARSAGKSMEHSYRYRLRFGTRFGCQNFRASFPGISKTFKRFSIGFGTMNYTVLGSQIPHLSKETHKKTSMTVHLTLKCECLVGKTTPCKHETSYGVQYKSTTCIHSRVKVDPEPHSDLVERGHEAPNPKKSRLLVHFSLNCECCTPLR